MKTFKLLFVAMFSLALIFTVSDARQYEFNVLGSKGNVSVKSGNSWKKIKTGNKLYTNDIIKVESGSYVGLVHRGGKALQIKNSGEFKISDLSKQAAGKKSSITGRFTDYVLKEMQDSDDLFGEGGHTSNMEITGSVERSIEDGISTDPQNIATANSLIIKSPVKVNLMANQTKFEWEPKNGVSKYQFILKDRFNREVMSKEIAATSIEIDAAKLKLNTDEYYIWNVTAANDPKISSEQACFLVYSDAKKNAIQDSLQMLKEELGEEDNAVAKIVMALYYEQNNLIYEAQASFQEAIELSDGIEDYKNMYNNFLARNKIRTE